MLKELASRLAESYYDVSFAEPLKDYILDSSDSETFGARPIKRFIQNTVETFLANKIIKGELRINTKYLLNYVEDELIITQM